MAIPTVCLSNEHLSHCISVNDTLFEDTKGSITVERYPLVRLCKDTNCHIFLIDRVRGRATFTDLSRDVGTDLLCNESSSGRWYSNDLRGVYKDLLRYLSTTDDIETLVIGSCKI